MNAEPRANHKSFGKNATIDRNTGTVKTLMPKNLEYSKSDGECLKRGLELNCGQFLSFKPS